MPKILEDLVSKLESKGKSTSSAYAIATSALQKSGKLKEGTRTLNKSAPPKRTKINKTKLGKV